MGRLTHFEILCRDMDRAERFYTEVFGWSIEKWAGPIDYRLITTGPEESAGINGALMLREGAPPAPDAPGNGYVCTISVDSIEATEKAVVAAGGTRASERHEIPGVGLHTYFTDTEGNTFGAIEEHPRRG